MKEYQNSFQKCGRDSFARLVGVEANWLCVYVSRICMHNLDLLVLIAPEISTFNGRTGYWSWSIIWILSIC